MGPVDVVFVCGGVDVQRAVSRDLLSALRRLAQRTRRPGLAVHRRLRARQGGTARQVPRRDPLGEHVGAARGVPADRLHRAALRDRPRPLHVLGRHRAARPDAQPDQGRPRAGHRAADLGAVHPRPHPQRPRPPAHSAAGAGRRLPRAPDQGGRADGGQHRGADVARCARGVDRRVAPPDRAPLQAASRPGADEVLPGAAAAPRARAAAADVDVDHGHHHGLRLPVAAALFQVLPQRVRVSAERRAADDPREGTHP